MFQMRSERQAGIATNVSYSKVILGQPDESVVSSDHFALSFLFCRQVNISTRPSGIPGNPTRLVIVSIWRTQKVGSG